VSIATFVFEDDGDLIACRVSFSGGFDRDSRAHQAGQMLVKLMDQHFENQGAPPEAPVKPPGLIVVEAGRALV